MKNKNSSTGFENTKTINIKDRHYGLDLFRIVAMLMVIILHQGSHGGGLSATDNLTVNGFLSHFLNALCVVSVNCYVLISSYFLAKEKFRFRQLFRIIEETWFYSWTILIILMLMGQEIVNLKASVLPISFVNNWFITAYVGMYILFPFMNIAINAMDKRQHRALIIVMMSIMALWSDLIPSANPYGSWGVSSFWFMALYAIGSYCRLYVDLEKYRKLRCLTVYVFIALLLTLSWVILHQISNWIPAVVSLEFYYCRFNSVLVVIQSVAIFMAFCKIQIERAVLRKIIKVISPLTLGVYLIHDNPSFKIIMWSKFFPVEDLMINSILLIPQIVGRTLMIFAACTVIDFFRSLIFKALEKTQLYNRFIGIVEVGIEKTLSTGGS